MSTEQSPTSRPRRWRLSAADFVVGVPQVGAPELRQMHNVEAADLVTATPDVTQVGKQGHHYFEAAPVRKGRFKPQESRVVCYLDERFDGKDIDEEERKLRQAMRCNALSKQPGSSSPMVISPGCASLEHQRRARRRRG